jgi:hypothetical protein
LSPCEGVCDATPFDAPYTSPKLGTGASCFETKTALAGGICNNFIDPARTLQVNGVGECDLATWSIPAPIRGGYCLQVSAGEPDYADFTLW